ncbi:MAG: ABC transporter permease [Clostridium sp.]|nr:ABC transporter permease [Clostridium sp.]
MKSYFNFLKRNKAYALIDALGLALSMMFVVLIGCYWWQETHIDSQHSKADRMYMVGLDWGGGQGRGETLGSNWRIQPILKGKFPEIEASTAIFRNHRWLSLDDNRIETDVIFVDSTFYDVFDFELISGDKHTALDDPRSAIVTEEYARRVWGDGDPMGKTIIFNTNEEPFVVTGVMEPMTNTMLMTDKHRPVDMLLNFSMVKYVNSSMTSEGMNNATGAEIVILTNGKYDAEELSEKYHEALKDDYWILHMPGYETKLKLFPFKDVYFSGIGSGNINVGSPDLTKLLFMTGVVILLFAIMNYINLTVALAGKRAKEMATRRLMGESRGAIMWRLVKESTLMCAVAFGIGIVLAILAKPYAESLLGTPIHFGACVNAITISFAVCVILIMGLASGITPAVLISSVKPIDAVKGAVKRRSNMVFGKIFIVLQNVCTIVMVASAITMYLQVRHLINAPLGYNTHGIAQMVLPYDGDNDQAFLSDLKGLACVDKVSLCWQAPLNGGNNNTMEHEGKTISFQTFQGDSCYMDILGLKVRKDNHLTSSMKSYVNDQAIAELGISEDTPDFQFYERRIKIAGIMEDFKIRDILSEQHPVIVEIGKAYEDFYPWNVMVKIKGDEREAIEQMKALYHEHFPGMSDEVLENIMLDDNLAMIYDKQSKLSTIIAIFAGIAVVISMLGLVAMSTFYVQQRSKEIAVRKVMGGTSMDVLGRLVRSFMLYVCVAAVIAIPVIYYVMNDWLSEYSYRIDLYWWIYALAIAQALIVCFLAVVAQSYRAANANPVATLKQND